MSIIKLDETTTVAFKRKGGTPALVAAAPRGLFICTRCHQPFPAGQYASHVRNSDHPKHQPIDIKTGRL